jgi:ArsR family transcriptional regulator
MSLNDACSRLAALSDPLRLRMMALMHREGELCVCELTHALAVPQPKASKHLAILREAGLARMRRDAQWALYSLAPDADPWLAAVMAATALQLDADPQLVEDRRRLNGMGGRPERERSAATAASCCAIPSSA